MPEFSEGARLRSSKRKGWGEPRAGDWEIYYMFREAPACLDPKPGSPRGVPPKKNRVQCQAHPSQRRSLPAFPLLNPGLGEEAPGAQEPMRGEGGLRQSRLSSGSFAHFAWRERERELESPWRLRWEGRRQLQLQNKKIKIKKDWTNFPSSRQSNKPAACPAWVLGHWLFPTSGRPPSGSTWDPKVPSKPPPKLPRGAEMGRAPGSGFSTKARAQHRLPPRLQPLPGHRLSSQVECAQPLSLSKGPVPLAPAESK